MTHLRCVRQIQVLVQGAVTVPIIMQIISPDQGVGGRRVLGFVVQGNPAEPPMLQVLGAGTRPIEDPRIAKPARFPKMYPKVSAGIAGLFPR
eukprot:1597235-Heterocapsa_arctica.AAC.1